MLYDSLQYRHHTQRIWLPATKGQLDLGKIRIPQPTPEHVNPEFSLATLSRRLDADSQAANSQTVLPSDYAVIHNSSIEQIL